MRTAAQVGEVALGVCGDVSVFEFADKLAFVLLAAVAEKLEGVCFGDVATYHGVGGTCQFEHLGLDAREVGGGDGIACGVDVIIEPVFDGGADAEFDSGEEFLQRFGQQVCAGVPKCVLGLGVVPFVECECGVALDGACQVPCFVVDGGGQYIGGETLADALGYF